MAGNVPLSRIALCTVQDIRNLVDPSLSGEQDPLLVQLINGFSKLVQGERYLNRSLEKKTYVEYFDGDTDLVIVSAPPILDNDTLYVWEDSDHLFEGDPLWMHEDYMVHFENGLIKTMWDVGFVEGTKVVKVQYDGGLVLHDELNDTLDVPDDLRSACAMQCSFWYQRRRELGISSVSSAGGDSVFFSPTQILPIVKEILGQYRHHNI